ncbi:uncharacterized protein LOC117178627 [Belonocnema kinseyi]|uniref:uncharacterized protein LOC117178627 n=1 Tax=Belonocnema kinseyi TaxID=2817044 RepID=UPI00143E0500|nr:uncharacterized protein LOC117178627 [Belonocnema kinseyi]
MAFLDSIGNVETYTELKRLIAELDNSEINDSLEKLNLDTFGTRKLKCSRLRKGIKLLKGWPTRDSDYTSATFLTTNDETEREIDFENLAAALPSNRPVNTPHIPVTTTVETREAHIEPQAGHLGNEKKFQRVALRYYWPGMFHDVVRYVRTGSPCQECKVEQARPVGMLGQRVVEQPWTDLFTKWIECVQIRTANGSTIRRAFEDLVVSRWGVPEVVHTDNGTEFVNKQLEQMCRSLGIIHTTTPVYHVQENPTERVNRVLKTLIVSFLQNNHQDWDLHLSEFRFAYNSALHGTVKVSPAFLNFEGNPLPYRTMRRDLERSNQHVEPQPEAWLKRMERLDHLRNWVCRNLDKAYETQTKYYNAGKRDRDFSVGDLVLRRNRKLSKKIANIASKLFPKFEGPFKIKRRLSPVVYTLRSKTPTRPIARALSPAKSCRNHGTEDEVLPTSKQSSDGPARWTAFSQDAQFPEIICPEGSPVNRAHKVFHHIRTTPGPPVAHRARRLSSDKYNVAKREFEGMLRSGTARPSASSWASPLHLVPKKGDEWRVCGDYRAFNDRTIPDRYPVKGRRALVNYRL